MLRASVAHVLVPPTRQGRARQYQFVAVESWTQFYPTGAAAMPSHQLDRPGDADPLDAAGGRLQRRGPRHYRAPRFESARTGGDRDDESLPLSVALVIGARMPGARDTVLLQRDPERCGREALARDQEHDVGGPAVAGQGRRVCE